MGKQSLEVSTGKPVAPRAKSRDDMTHAVLPTTYLTSPAAGFQI